MSSPWPRRVPAYSGDHLVTDGSAGIGLSHSNYLSCLDISNFLRNCLKIGHMRSHKIID